MMGAHQPDCFCPDCIRKGRITLRASQAHTALDLPSSILLTRLFLIPLEMENLVPSPEFRAVTEDSKGPDALSHVLIGQMGFEF